MKVEGDMFRRVQLVEVGDSQQVGIILNREQVQTLVSAVNSYISLLESERLDSVPPDSARYLDEIEESQFLLDMLDSALRQLAW